MAICVSCKITLTSSLSEKQNQILKDIKKTTGIARYYLPMPEDLANSTAGLPSEKSIKLKEKYGYENWLNWALKNWGTKWGCCEFDVKDNILTYSTANSPLSESIIQRFANDFPNFDYMWKREEGDGAYRKYIDGECQHSDDWNIPNWGEHQEVTYFILDRLNIQYLAEDYSKMGVTYKRGFYSDYDLENFISNDPKEILKRYIAS